MATKKQYESPDFYEKKLARVMERFGADKYNYNFDRHSAWIEFWLNGQMYRFDHSVDKAREKGFALAYGSDVFAQVVITLEDLVRMAERGIYHIQTWLEGMKFLPPPVTIPDCLKALGYDYIPDSVEEVKARYKTLVMQHHPDTGGSEEAFKSFHEQAKQAVEFITNRQRQG